MKKKNKLNNKKVTVEEARFLKEKYLSQLQTEILKARCEGLGLGWPWGD